MRRLYVMSLANAPGAGSTFPNDKRCPNMSCDDFVLSAYILTENGSAFEDARWEVDYVRVYTDKCPSRAVGMPRPRILTAGIVVTIASLLVLA